MQSYRSHPLNAETPSIRASAFAPLVRYFRQNSQKLEPLLKQNGLKPRDIQDPYTIIPLSAFLGVLEDAAVALKDPVLGARLGVTLTPAELGPTGILMSQSSTIRRGLERFHSSFSALQGTTEMVFSDTNLKPQITYQLNSAFVTHQPQDTEFSLSGICHLIRIAFDLRWNPEEVHFKHAGSKRPDLLEKLFRAPVLFGQATNRVIIPVDSLDNYHRDEDQTLIQLIEHHVHDLAVANPLSLKDRVSLVVSRRLGQASIDLASVAQELGLTPRSLQRHLAQDGTSLRKIIQEHRMQIARSQLADRSVSVSAVAQSMGYSDSTAFGRAFRLWSGKTPTGKNQRKI